MSTTTAPPPCEPPFDNGCCSSNAEVGNHVGVTVAAQDSAATDSGRESVNEFDSSLDETTSTQLSKKPCTAEFYASSGSQTKWYLKPETSSDEGHNNYNGDDDDEDDVGSVHTARRTSLNEQQQIDEAKVCDANISRESSIFPKTTTTNDSTNVIGIRNGFNANLSQQMRAVSSPSLTEPQEFGNGTSVLTDAAIAETTLQPLSCNAASTTNSASSSTESHNQHSSNLPTSQSVGVLQKFKRTLTNFNKNSQQQSTSTTSATTAVAGAYSNSGNLLAPPSTSNELTQDDTTLREYRFGPLIWRSSKERRKTKYNRRDKCNSGDSGIQIELENDEQFARVVANGGSRATATRNADDEDSPKQRAIRRTNSAKATTIGDQSSTAAMSAKAKILKKMEICNEREAPESLPTRSLSQPNGLETFGIGHNDLDDSDSDSVASHDEGPCYYPIYAEVLYSFTAAGPQELGLERGTLIEILRKEVGPWWFGRIKKEDASLVEEILDPELGWFPKDFVRIIQSPESDLFFLAYVAQMQLQPSTSAKKLPSPCGPPPTTQPQCAIVASASTMEEPVDQNNVTTIVIESTSSFHNTNVDNTPLVTSRSCNVIMDNADILRRSAIKELLDTEVNYVKLLASICEGYLPAMSKRIDIFTPNSVRLIFSNITAIYKFQRKFLEALRKGIDQNQIAKVFLKLHKGFLCYSTYCNAYPRALIELETYDRVKDAKTILDNCREAENLAELPLSAHLLAPVQRICRYPLHLGEIIKTAAKSADCSAATAAALQQLEKVDASQLDIADTRDTIDMALDAMKSVTEAVNEGKRHSETIARHQASFQNFKGPPLHLHSTRFFLQIDATRQKQNLWNSSCTLFLFDNQLVYCKRDIIKRSQFIYKGRIFLDRCRVVNVRDGKMFGHTIKNSLRIYCESRDKWFDFSFRSANRKHRFLSTIALERQFGGKAFYVSEMTGFEYAYEERDHSDNSDYEMPESENGSSVQRLRDYVNDVAANSSAGGGTGTGTSGSGDSSVPESPAKAYKYSSATFPKKSQNRSSVSVSINSNETQTDTLGRRRLGNWFRKPKSANCTPNHSPTHKPLLLQSATELQSADAVMSLTSDGVGYSTAIVVEHVREISTGSSS